MNFYELAFDDIGTYPKSTVKDGITIERTEWQEGWNACSSKILNKVIAFEKWFSSLEDDKKNLLEKAEDYRYVKLCDDGQVKCFINCNDFFWWACSDCEELDDWNLLEQSLNDAEDDGCLLYCANDCILDCHEGSWYFSTSSFIWREFNLFLLVWWLVWLAISPSLASAASTTLLGCISAPPHDQKCFFCPFLSNRVWF